MNWLHLDDRFHAATTKKLGNRIAKLRLKPTSEGAEELPQVFGKERFRVERKRVLELPQKRVKKAGISPERGQPDQSFALGTVGL